MFRALETVLVLMVVGVLTVVAVGYGPRLTSQDEAVRMKSVESLRKEGPSGLRHALERFDELQGELESAAETEQVQALREQLELWRHSVDQIAGQRDATASRLFWYTDMNQAKAIAAKEGKPILSLRMLGKLTDQYSCANSRFFRTSLYANQEISELMRDKFVLHWKSVRPVPKVTIDFGDGRKLQRTVTGNSAHYLLSSEGRPLDVLPGLYSPTRFREWLQSGENLHTNFKDVVPEHRKRYLAQVHAERLTGVTMRLSRDLRKVGRLDVLNDFRTFVRESALSNRNWQGGYGGEGHTQPTAWEVGPIAVTKAGLEIPILQLIKLDSQPIEKMIDDQLWQNIAALHRGDVQLDDNSVALIRRENPDALQAGEIAVSKRIVEDPILRVVRRFENSIALDTVRNEYLLHRRVHEWFARGDAMVDVNALNERVYTELFLTPSSDPWLGLAPEDGYTALDRGGLSIEATR